MTLEETREFKSALGEAAHPQERRARKPWHAPFVRVLPAADSETGANSNPDLNATFS